MPGKVSVNRILATLLLFLPALSAAAEDPSLEIAAGRKTDGALTWFKQGVDLSQKGDYREALARFERARQLAPNWALPYVEIAVAHLMTDNDREVIGQALGTAVNLGKDIPRAHYLYGVFLQESGRRQEAVEEFTKALQLRPSLVDARYRLATLYVEEGRQTDGIQQFEYVIQGKANHLGALRDLAVLYEQSGQLEKAESELKAIVVQNPGNGIHLSNLGKFYERVGWMDKARAAFQQAERLDPTKEKRNLRPLQKSKR